ncbi:MAG: TIGR04372 family glycosyltransferase, partial [Bacteroidota bacterium]|nr:TIGR04372 family glycosyltransferase [Bacteroidota bacterium]
PLTLQHHKVIDYAINYRNDFMDVYLVSKCKYFLGTSAGICDLATVMDKPRISVNYAPIGVALFGKDSLYIPKKLKNEKTGMYIPLYAVLKNNWDKNWVDNDWLNQHCYEYEDNTPEEILEATIEMHKRSNGHFKMSSEENDLIKKYFDLFQTDNLSYNSQTPVGLDFLKKNPDVFWGEGNLNEF